MLHDPWKRDIGVFIPNQGPEPNQYAVRETGSRGLVSSRGNSIKLHIRINYLRASKDSCTPPPPPLLCTVLTCVAHSRRSRFHVRQGSALHTVERQSEGEERLIAILSWLRRGAQTRCQCNRPRSRLSPVLMRRRLAICRKTGTSGRTGQEPGGQVQVIDRAKSNKETS